MRIILIAGKAGSGKNEVARLLRDNLDKSLITGFSKYIKLFALEFSNWDGKDINKPRELLQSIGDKLRAVDKNFLTSRLKEDIEVYKNENYENIIISDVRLINEINYFKELKEYNVITIRVNSHQSKRNLTEEEKHHHTELELDNYNDFDYIINNNFDDKLKDDVLKIVKGLK